MKKFLYLLFILLIIGVVVGLFYAINLAEEKEAKFIQSKYILIDTTYHHEIRAKYFRESNRIVRGARVIDFTNNFFLIVSPLTRNWAYDKAYLMDFIERNDSIYKRANSDTLFVYRNNKECYFILGKSINER